MMSPQELADFLNLPLATIYRWRHLGEGPRASKLGRHVRYRRADVEAWLDARSLQPHSKGRN
jgi:excisionase family DNA binding protein